VTKAYQVILVHIEPSPSQELHAGNTDSVLQGFLNLPCGSKILKAPFPSLLTSRILLLSGFEFNKYVQITVRAKVFSEERTKKRQLSDMVFFAKPLYLLFGNLNLSSFYHRLTSLIQEFLLPKPLSLITIRIFLIIVTPFLLYSRLPFRLFQSKRFYP